MSQLKTEIQNSEAAIKEIQAVLDNKPRTKIEGSGIFNYMERISNMNKERSFAPRIISLTGGS